MGQDGDGDVGQHTVRVPHPWREIDARVIPASVFPPAHQGRGSDRSRGSSVATQPSGVRS